MPPSGIAPNVKPCGIVKAGCRLVNSAWYVTAQPASQEFAGIAAAGVRKVLSVRTPGEPNPPPFDFGEPATLQSLHIPFLNAPFAHGMSQEQFNVEATAAAFALVAGPLPMLVHCSTGDRASSAFATMLILFEQATPHDAADWAKAHLFLAAFYDYVKHYVRPEGWSAKVTPPFPVL
jgi:protein tyrosine phosphatase (PTP) superfamily phosphohydrolase (DUF442 family)